MLVDLQTATYGVLSLPLIGVLLRQAWLGWIKGRPVLAGAQAQADIIKMLKAEIQQAKQEAESAHARLIVLEMILARQGVAVHEAYQKNGLIEKKGKASDKQP